MKFEFLAEQLCDFEQNIRKEWVLTNGIGGYAGSSVIGAHNRTHQGYLIASLHPPVERYLVFSKTNERFVQGGVCYDLETSQHIIGRERDAGTGPAAEAVYTPDAGARRADRSGACPAGNAAITRAEGNRFLTGFCFDGCAAYSYAAGALAVKKQIAMTYGQNETAVAYEFINDGDEATFFLTPLMNFREHGASSDRENLCFFEETGEHVLLLTPKERPDVQISLLFGAGELIRRKKQYDIDMHYQTEADNEAAGLDCHYTPYDIKLTIPKHSRMTFGIVCNVKLKGRDNADWAGPEAAPGRCFFGWESVRGKSETDRAFFILERARARRDDLICRAGYGEDDFVNTLVAAADNFLAYRASTGGMTVLAGLPWFTDWGRDTMIAFTGLTLCTKRFSEARQILKTFAKYVRHGIVPNMFPDDGQDPLYNTADASLWFFYASDQYLRYVDDNDARAFIRAEIYPALKKIVAAYRDGTDFSIYMDTDGLIHAGSGLDQVTWMDVRVGDWVVTPRHGKPVEINALWYNALRVMEKFAGLFGEDAAEYQALAERTKQSFAEQFWYEEGGYLCDVVDGAARDKSLRPNQIYAVSLPYTMLDPNREASIVAVVEKELYVGRGLRSLSPNHPDYHPVYQGALKKRDAAYHQGTAWGFLLGAFISAYTKVHGHSAESIAQAKAFLKPVWEQFYEGGIGTISEIFDGDAPHNCRGCFAQAWSVGEVLRCCVEEVILKECNYSELP